MKSDIYLFMLYSLAVIIIYYVIPPKMRKYELFIANMLFYFLCDYRFLGLIMGETVLGYYGGKIIAENQEDKKIKRKNLFFLFIFLICIILVFFKYFNFFAEASHISFPTLLMPVGISYFSFRIISYIADVYTGKRCPEECFVDFSVYVDFFPHLLCGPIARSESMLEEIKQKVCCQEKMVCRGCELVILGLFKKVVIADRLSGYVNTIFSTPQNYPALALWIGAIGYSIQLYCDFGGYSDVAIGITNILGFKCEDNFRRPYLSGDIQEFWKRWHISLSSWLRDYIYIPMGGNRTGKGKKIRNVMMTFIVCGIWHGSQIHYLIWGIYHGLLNVLHTLFFRKIMKTYKVLHVIGYIGTFLMVMLGWIFFRADNTFSAFIYIYRMFTKVGLSYNVIVSSIIPFTGDNSCVAYFITLCMMVLLLVLKEIFDERELINKNKIIWNVIFLLCILLFGMTGGSSFLYANY